MQPETIDDIVDFVINKGHGVQGLSTMGLKTVPRSYIQPPEERLDASKIVSGNESIPIIDVSSWEDQAASKAICEAARRFGFFQIINHGIEEEVLMGVQRAAHRFFELPVEEKIKYKDDDCRSSVKLGTSFSPAKETVFEWKDYLHLQYESHESALQRWPPICKNEAVEYYKRVEQLVKNIYNVLLKGLTIETGVDESKRPLLMGMVAVNFNYYPFCPNPELTVGVGRHSDASALTVLLQDDVGGLYVRAPQADDQGESWIHVPPRRGALVINIGDMLQLLSNGRYRSVEHKVVVDSTKNRLSVAVFVNPAPAQVVAPLPEVLEDTGERPLYREVVYSDYLEYFFSKGHDGKTTIEWAKI